MAKRFLKPGETAPDSGIYERRGSRGGDTNDQRPVSKGEQLPPTRKPGESWELVQKVHHRK